MDLYLTIKKSPAPPKEDEPDGWYIAKHCSTDYNRILFVSENIIVVFSENYSQAQIYDSKNAKRLYKDWKPASRINMEVE